MGTSVPTAFFCHIRMGVHVASIPGNVKLLLHILRGLLGFGAIAFWCAGVSIVPLAVVSTLALTVPLFVLPMAVVFL